MSEAYSPQQSFDLLYMHTLQDTENGKHIDMFVLYAAPCAEHAGTFKGIMDVFNCFQMMLNKDVESP
jgi:hypothetical protein